MLPLEETDFQESEIDHYERVLMAVEAEQKVVDDKVLEVHEQNPGKAYRTLARSAGFSWIKKSTMFISETEKKEAQSS